MVQELHQRRDAGHPRPRLRDSAFHADVCAGHGGQTPPLKMHFHAAVGDADLPRQLDGGSHASAVFHLAQRRFIAETAAELLREPLNVLHRQVQPGAVKTAAGPELDDAVLRLIAVDPAALAGGSRFTAQQGGSDGPLRLRMAGGRQGPQGLPGEIQVLPQRQLAGPVQLPQPVLGPPLRPQGLQLLKAHRQQEAAVEQQQNHNGDIFQPVRLPGLFVGRGQLPLCHLGVLPGPGDRHSGLPLWRACGLAAPG